MPLLDGARPPLLHRQVSLVSRQSWPCPSFPQMTRVQEHPSPRGRGSVSSPITGFLSPKDVYETDHPTTEIAHNFDCGHPLLEFLEDNPHRTLVVAPNLKTKIGGH